MTTEVEPHIRRRSRPTPARWVGPAARNGQAPVDLDVLSRIADRVLWLATRMIHEANVVRPNPDRTKVGGHQASSASVVSILTALYFGNWLRAGDRVSIKPHASPAYHAVQYLLGNLDRRYLTMLRQYKGLQAYPSRTKDPDPVDFSTGSVGLGAVAPVFAALADRYAECHFRKVSNGRPPRRRFVALVGDAELDEGNVWEALSDEAVRSVELGNVLWIVDLNRQSLDRVIPGIKVREVEALFASAGWRVLEAKYGRRLQALFAGPGGVALRRRIDDMSNEEYHALIRAPGARARELLLAGAPPSVRDALARSVAGVPDDELTGVLMDLGGHDLAELLACFELADADPTRPTVLFAYTIKGWGLPFAGDPLNHSALLTQQQLDALRQKLGISPADEWARFPEDSPEGRLCAQAAARLYPDGPRPPLPPLGLAPEDVPVTVGARVAATTSTQEAFGNVLVELARTTPAVARRIVTVSPDVSISTNLGGWINRQGVWAERPAPKVEEAGSRLIRWEPGPTGQHIELGIAEMNLFLLLGQLGLSYELNGDLLLPVGTVYDPFVCRGLDALIYSLYGGGKFVFAGTPSGVTLSPEGGAHQSTITVSIGIELPNLVLYEPAFARETEWVLLEAFRQCLDRAGGLSTYLRLSTRPVDQGLLEPALRRLGEAELRRQVLAGGYRLVDARLDAPDLPADAPVVQIATAGALVPEAVEAARTLHEEGVAANVLCLTSADRLYRAFQSARRRGVQTATVVEEVGHFGALVPPAERDAPIVTVLDGASHALAFLGSVFGVPVVPLGVDGFGQSGSRQDVYHGESIDAASVVNGALLALELNRR